MSKCLQLVLYGMITGYEVPRMLSRFARPQSPERDTSDNAEADAAHTRPEIELQCTPGNELESPMNQRVREIVDAAKKSGCRVSPRN